MSTLTGVDNAIATAQVLDACMRLKIPYRVAPPGIKPVVPLMAMVYGPTIPVRHYGSVDIFLEVLEATSEKGILVIDNGGRNEEACIGDLTVLETKYAGMQAILVWGLHRDTKELLEIGFPVFSYGTCPAGPARLDSREADALVNARFGDFLVTKFDTAFVDQDGVIFLETRHIDQVLSVAKTIRERESQQADAAKQGVSLRKQFQFEAYLKQRAIEEDYTFRKHLSTISKSIEE